MTMAKRVTALLAFAVGMSVAFEAGAQSPDVVPLDGSQGGPRKITVKPVPTAAKPAPTQAAKPATAAASVKPAGSLKVGAPKPAQQVAANAAARGPVMRSASAGRAVSSRPPSSIRGTRYGAVPVMPSPYALPHEKLPPPADDGSPRTLSFHSVNTQETVTVTFWRDGRYIQSELDQLNGFLRDSRNGDLVQMDPQLFDVLWHVRRALGTDAPYQVLSAYRSPETNAWLASASRGVAWDSMHMRGQAIDVKLPGRTPMQIRQAARALGLGGVGYYPRSGFVHLDTGPVRYW